MATRRLVRIIVGENVMSDVASVGQRMTLQ